MNEAGASPASPPAEQPTALPAGRLVENLMFFARTLRAAGLPIGPGRVAEALRAVEAVGISRRDDFYWTLHSVFVNRRTSGRSSIRLSMCSGAIRNCWSA
jgi:hypothetical protein